MKKMNRVLAILLAFLLTFGNMVDTVVYAVDLTSETQPTETVAEPTPDVGGALSEDLGLETQTPPAEPAQTEAAAEPAQTEEPSAEATAEPTAVEPTAEPAPEATEGDASSDTPSQNPTSSASLQGGPSIDEAVEAPKRTFTVKYARTYFDADGNKVVGIGQTSKPVVFEEGAPITEPDDDLIPLEEGYVADPYWYSDPSMAEKFIVDFTALTATANITLYTKATAPAKPEATEEPEATPEPTEEPEATPAPEATEQPEATPAPEATAEPTEAPEGKEYILNIVHVLNSDYGVFEQQETVKLTAEELADGYDVLTHALVKEGLVLDTDALTLTEADFDASASAVVTVQYKLAEGYKVVAPKAGEGMSDQYKGKLSDVTFEQEGQFTVTIQVVFDTDEAAAAPVTVGVAENDAENWSYVLEGDYGDYDVTVEPEGFEYNPASNAIAGTVTAETTEITVKLTRKTAKVTVHFEGLREEDAKAANKQTDFTYDATVGESTDVEKNVDGGLAVEGYTYDYEDTTVVADGTEVTVTYTLIDCYVRYDSQGGSYVNPQMEAYGSEVEIWKGTEATKELACGQEEHNHTEACRSLTCGGVHTHTAGEGYSYSSSSNMWGENYTLYSGSGYYGRKEMDADEHKGETFGCFTATEHSDWQGKEYYSWDLTCGKTEHSQHRPSCYSYTCGQTAHTHTDSCYRETPATYTPAPTREGYVFAGWYMEPECKTLADKSVTLKEDVTVYAKWEAGKATYSVVSMQEVWKEGGNYYAYMDTTTGEGTIGTMTNVSASARIPAYHSAGVVENVEIKADGSSVAYVKYPLQVYTFEFNLKNSNATLTMNGTEYTGGNLYSFTAVYGQSLDGLWPYGGDITGNSNPFIYWDPSNTTTNYVTKRDEVTGEMLDNAGNNKIVYTAYYGREGAKRVNYWLEQLDNSYALSEKYSQDYYRKNSVSSKEIYGFTEETTRPSGNIPGTQTRYPDTNEGYPNYSVSTKNYYYSRNRYSITYYYKSNELKKIGSIPFEKDISTSEYNWTPSANDAGVPEDYIFEGWYDNASGAGDKYTFGTMPGGDLVLYAKFTPPTKTVTFDYQYDSKKDEVPVTKGKTVSPPTDPTRNGYAFEGWFTDSTGGTKYEFSKPVEGDLILYAHWTQRTSWTYTVTHEFVDENGTKVWSTEETKTVSSKQTQVTVQAWSFRKDDGYQETYGSYVPDEYSQTVTPEQNDVTFKYTAPPAAGYQYTVKFTYGDQTVYTVPENGEPLKADYANNFLVNVKEEWAQALRDLGYKPKTYSQRKNLAADSKKNVFEFKLEPIPFKITYELNGGTAPTPPNPTEYTVEGLKENAITLTNPTRDGYEFAGWTMGEGTSHVSGVDGHINDDKGSLSTNVVIDGDTVGDLTFVANWLFPHVKVEKTADKREGLTLGEIVTYTITVTNDGDAVLKDLAVVDEQTGLNEKIETLLPFNNDNTESFTTTHTITEKDIVAGQYDNTVTVSGQSQLTEWHVYATAKETVKTEEQRKELTAQKKLTNAGSGEGGKFKAGETATFDITVTNSGNTTQTSVTVSEQLEGATIVEGKGYEIVDGNAVIKNMAPGATVTVQATYQVTQKDIDSGTELKNVATVAGDGDTEPKPETEIPTEEQKPALTVEKTANKTEGAALGEEITYTITVTNSGNVTVSDVTVTDPLTELNQNVGTLAPKASTSVTTKHTITEADILAGSFVNTATAKGKDPKDGEVTGSDNETVTTVAQNPAMTVEKTANKTTDAALGEEITYTITVTNSGNVTVSDITVTDPLTGLNQSVGTLAPGASTSVTTTHTITEADILAGSFENTATATGKDPKGGEITDDGSVTVTTVEQNPALTVVKTANKTSGAALGEEITYTIKVTNSGNVTVSDIAVTDPLTNLDQSVGTLAPGASAEAIKTTYTVQEKDILEGKVDNTATATGTDPNGGAVTGSGSATVTTVEKNPGLTTTKTLTNKGTGENGAFKVNETAKFDITVTNNGNITQKNVTVTEGLAGAKILNSEDGSYTVNEVGTVATITEIAPKTSVTVKAEYTVTQADIDNKTELANTATIGGEGSTGPDPVPIPKDEQKPGLTTTKTLTNSGSGENGAFKANETAEFDITVTNSGNTTQTNVTVTEQLAGATIVEGEGYTINEAGQAVIAKMAPNAVVVVKATYTVTQADIDSDAELKNVALVKGDNGEDPDPTPEIPIPEAEKKPELSVEKEVVNRENAPFDLYETIQYKITVKNTGNVTLTNLYVEDSLTHEIWSPNDGTGAEHTQGTLAPGESKVFETSYTVTLDDLDHALTKTEITNIATAHADASGEDKQVTAQASATAAVATPKAALTVTKKVVDEDEDKEYGLGETVTYEITVKNTGNVTVSGIDVIDEQADDSYQGMVWVIEKLTPGTTEGPFTVTHTITENDIKFGNGSFNNTATATGKDPNGGQVTDDGSVTVATAKMAPALTVEKTADKTEGAELNDVITYTIKVTNSGNVTVSDITVTDPKTGLEESVGTLAPGASAEAITTTYTVQEKDILEGKIENTATATGIDPKDGKVTGSGKATVTTVEAAPALTVEKTADKTEGAELNDVINYTITVTNTGNVTVKNITVVDEKTGLEESVGTLAPGKDASVTTTHTITEADILAGSFVNTATATGKDPNGGEVTKSGSVTVNTVAQAPALTVEKTASKTSGAALGEEITYTIKVTNSGNVTVKNITVTDPKTGLEESVGTLAPGKDASVTTTHTITEADILAGSFVNTATATGTAPNNEEVTGSDDETVITVEQAPALTVTKTASKTSGAALGEEITYTITVTNSGNVTVSGITVEDPLTGLEESIGTLAPKETASVTTTHTITEADILAGSFVNTATATGTDPNGGEVTGSGDETVTTAEQAPVLTVTKTANKTSDAALGEEITYTIKVTNSGNVTVKNITVTDPLTGLEKSVGTLAPGKDASVTTTHTITEEDILAGSFVNTATAKGTDPSNEDVSSSDDETVTTAEQAPVLTVTKTANKTSDAALGEEITYTITVTNSGNVTVSDITVEDPLTGLEESVGTLAPGEDASVTTTHTITEEDILAGSFVNTATATGTDPNGGKGTGSDDETVTTVAQAPALTVEKTANKTSGAELNDVITYTITVTNTGNVTVSDITVVDEKTGFKQIIETLAPGKRSTFTTEHKITEADILAGSYENTATVTGTDPNGGEVPGSDTVTVETVEPNGHLTISKETTSTPANSETYAFGETIEYSITATNDGNLTITDITVTDELTKDTWTIDSLEPGASETFTAEYVVTEADILAGSVVNVATATGTSTDPDEPEVPVNPGEETVPTEPKEGHMTISKTTTSTPANGETYVLGETITYEITATNDGNLTVKDITVTDALTGDEWTIASLAPGESKTFTATHVVTEADILAGSVVNVATAKGTSPDPDEPEVPVEPGEEEVPTEPKEGHVTITKTATSEPANGEAYALGETITYEITATNDGNLTVENITVTDELTGDAWTIESLAPGASETFTAEYIVTEADILAGTVLNVATATGTSTDPDEPDVPVEPGEEEVPTDPKEGHVTITKTATSEPANGEAYALGETITYEITATNDGNLTITDVTVTDELTSDAWTIESLAPGASETFTAEHVVTEADILAGSVVNVATATGTSPDPEEPEVPVEPGDTEDQTDPKEGHVTITKTATSEPANGETYALGETITYEITATNDGNLTVKDITVTDALTGDEWTIESLEPGASESFTTEYVVTEADVEAGSVVNVATATGTSPDEDEPDVPVDPDEETVPTEPTEEPEPTPTPTPTPEPTVTPEPTLTPGPTEEPTAEPTEEPEPSEEPEPTATPEPAPAPGDDDSPTTPDNPTTPDIPVNPNPVTPVTPVTPAAPDAPVVPAAPVVVPDDPTPLAPAPDEPTPEEPTPIEEEPTPLAPEPDEPQVIEEEDTPLAPEPSTIDENETPLADQPEEMNCCILHLIIMLVAFIGSVYYTHDRKRRQRLEFDTREEIEFPEGI